jgi:hypothetical protein
LYDEDELDRLMLELEAITDGSSSLYVTRKSNVDEAPASYDALGDAAIRMNFETKADRMGMVTSDPIPQKYPSYSASSAGPSIMATAYSPSSHNPEGSYGTAFCELHETNFIFTDDTDLAPQMEISKTSGLPSDPVWQEPKSSDEIAPSHRPVDALYFLRVISMFNFRKRNYSRE